MGGGGRDVDYWFEVSLLFLDPCINVLCRTGQECVSVSGMVVCVCKKSCPAHENPICGSNGMTFPNHCELHKTACLQNKKIYIKHNGTCKGCTINRELYIQK